MEEENQVEKACSCAKVKETKLEESRPQVVMSLQDYLHSVLSCIALGVVLPDMILAIQEFTRHF